MFLSVKHIEASGVRVERQLRPQPLTAADGRVIPFEPALLTGQVSRRRGGFRLQGALTTAGTVECARCLEPFRLPLEARFDLFYAAAEVGSGADPEAEEEAETFAPVVDEQIDLTALVAEQIYLNLPLKPLCGAGCRGLCPSCGVNLNLAACRCGSGAGEALPR